jgi:hypothetical protein
MLWLGVNRHNEDRIGEKSRDGMRGNAMAGVLAAWFITMIASVNKCLGQENASGKLLENILRKLETFRDRR